MNVLQDTYSPRIIFKNGHLNTIITSLFRNPEKVLFHRERLITSDQDFLDIDLVRNQSSKAAFLFHGLEGSSASQYIHGAAKIFLDQGWDVIVMNYRGCSGISNLKPYSYHSGQTDDVDFVINHYINQYKNAVLVGFSLGGNKIMKYNADHKFDLHPSIKATISISAPIDLKGGAYEICKTKNRLYEKRFLKTLIQKAKKKNQEFPGLVKDEDLNKIKSLVDFDDVFTGPVHGFDNAEDYYSQCNSKQFLGQLRIPALLLNAKDDPFLPDSCYPTYSKSFNLLSVLFPKYGGHVGFNTSGKSYYWSEIEILNFAEKHTL